MPENKYTLFDAAQEMAALHIAMDADLDEVDEAKALEVVNRALSKVDRFVAYLSYLETHILHADNEIERLKARRKSMLAHLDWLKSYAVRIMEETKQEELNGETSTIKTAKNPPSVAIHSEDLIPAEFKTLQQSVFIDKAAIKARLKAGKEVPGASLVQTKRLEVK